MRARTSQAQGISWGPREKKGPPRPGLTAMGETSENRGPEGRNPEPSKRLGDGTSGERNPSGRAPAGIRRGRESASGKRGVPMWMEAVATAAVLCATAAVFATSCVHVARAAFADDPSRAETAPGAVLVAGVRRRRHRMPGAHTRDAARLQPRLSPPCCAWRPSLQDVRLRGRGVLGEAAERERLARLRALVERYRENEDSIEPALRPCRTRLRPHAPRRGAARPVAGGQDPAPRWRASCTCRTIR